MSTQPGALWLADWLDVRACGGDNWNAKMNAAAAKLRRQQEEITQIRHAAAATNRCIADLVAQRDALLEALRLIEMDARVMRPYVGQVTKLGEIARAAIKSVEGEKT